MLVDNLLKSSIGYAHRKVTQLTIKPSVPNGVNGQRFETICWLTPQIKIAPSSI